MTRFQHLQFTEHGRVRLAEVDAFLDHLADEGHPVADQARAELEDSLAYLDHYGGTVDDDDPRRRFRVELGSDWAPLSFSVVWRRLDPTTQTYTYAFQGGLIWHGGSNDPLTVSLDAALWGIHT